MAAVEMMAALGKFLETASMGHVQIEYASVPNRHRLGCRHCDATFTILDATTLSTDYKKFGLLPYPIQTFAKAHRHPPEELNNAQAKLEAAKEEARKKLESLLGDMKFKDPKAVIKELSSAKCECGETCPCSQHGFGFAKPPARTGRKFRQ
jgi:hypothetical protein